MGGGAVVCVLLAVAVFPTGTFLDQRADRAEAERRLEVLRDQNAAYEDQIERLQTPEEIERIGREEYNLVFPGEEAYAILPAPLPELDLPTVFPFGDMLDHHHRVTQPPIGCAAMSELRANQQSAPTHGPAAARHGPGQPMSVFGDRVVRVEDPKLLTDGGVYVADLRDPRARRRPARHLRAVDHRPRPAAVRRGRRRAAPSPAWPPSSPPPTSTWRTDRPAPRCSTRR